MKHLYYPPPSFSFIVHFEYDNKPLKELLDCQFQSVSGLSYEILYDKIQQGGDNTNNYFIPSGKVKYSNLILKRGLLANSELTQWCNKILDNQQFNPQNLVIHLLDMKLVPMISWQIIGALPVKWSVDDFSATESKIAIETIELNYQSLKVITLADRLNSIF